MLPTQALLHSLLPKSKLCTTQQPIKSGSFPFMLAVQVLLPRLLYTPSCALLSSP